MLWKGYLKQQLNAEMRLKLKDCLKVRIKDYQHQGPYIEGDKGRYQHQDLNAWLGPAVVLCHRGNTVWTHTNSNIKKGAAC